MDSHSWQHHGHVASSFSLPCICDRHGQPSGWACQYDLHQQQFLEKNSRNVNMQMKQTRVQKKVFQNRTNS